MIDLSRPRRVRTSVHEHERAQWFLIHIVFFLGTWLVSTSSYAAKTTDQQRTDFIVGNFEFVLLHELAHLIIGDKDVPILGPIETAADYVATTMVLRGNGTEEAARFLNTALHNSAKSFSTSWRLSKEQGVEVPYWDVHALGIQRHYAILCLLYGSDPDKQIGIILDLELPRDRAAGCVNEYAAADRGLEWLIDNYGRQSDDRSKVKIDFRYGGTTTDIQAQAVAEIRRLGLLEQTVKAVDELFAIEEPFAVIMRVCGRPEAAWRAQRRELMICNELFDAFAKIYQSNTNP